MKKRYDAYANYYYNYNKKGKTKSKILAILFVIVSIAIVVFFSISFSNFLTISKIVTMRGTITKICILSLFFYLRERKDRTKVERGEYTDE